MRFVMFSFNIRIVHITLVKHRFPWAENFPPETAANKFPSLLGLGLGLGLKVRAGWNLQWGNFPLGDFPSSIGFKDFIYIICMIILLLSMAHIYMLQKYYQDKLSTITSDINQLKVSSKNYIEYCFHTKSFTLRRYTNIR